MKSRVIQNDAGDGAVATDPPPVASTSPGTRRSGRIVAGAITAAVGIGVLAGGGALVGVHATQRDGDGFYPADAAAIDTPTRALVSDDLDVGTSGPDWLLSDGRLADLRLAATGARDGPIFVGIGPAAAVDAYLDGVAHEVTGFDGANPATPTLLRGAATPAPPASEGFWAQSASGAGRQSVVWPLEKGDWAAVVMNADGTAGVSVQTRLAVKTDLVLWLGLGVLVAGAGLAGVGVALMVSGRRREAEADATA